MPATTGALEPWVVVTPMFLAKGQTSARLSWPWEGLDDLRWRLQPRVAARMPRDVPLQASVVRYKGQPKKKGKTHAILSLGAYDAIILRQSLVAKVHAALGLPTTDWRPVHLFEDGALLDTDFALFDPVQTWPLDRDARDATWSEPANPHASCAVNVHAVRWSPGRAPPGVACRLLEFPELLLMRRDVAEALVRASQAQLTLLEPPLPTERPFMAPAPRPHIPTQHPEATFPWTPPGLEAPEAAKRTAEAFWRIAERFTVAGPTPGLPFGEPDDRRLVCQNPHYARALAQAVDREAFDDSASAVLGSPLRALQFAMWVDGGPDDTTRLAACRLPATAYAYATFVDRGRHAETAAAVAGDTWGMDYDKMTDEAPRVWDVLLGQAAVTPPEAVAPPVAPRAWPTHDTPRYATSSPDVAAERRHTAMAADLRSDIDAFIGHGLALVELGEDAPPDAVVSAIHRFVGRVQAREVKLGAKKKRTVMALGCALGEQVRRVLGWRWATVATPSGGGVAVIPEDAAVAFHPLSLIERLLTPGAKANTTALQFNMLVAGSLPPGAVAGAYAAVS